MPLLGREITELTIPRLNGEVLDNHTHYTIHNGPAQSLQTKERHRRRYSLIKCVMQFSRNAECYKIGFAHEGPPYQCFRSIQYPTV